MVPYDPEVDEKVRQSIFARLSTYDPMTSFTPVEFSPIEVAEIDPSTQQGQAELILAYRKIQSATIK